MRALLDTSVLIGADAPGELEGAISAASLAELSLGVIAARDTDERARRAQRPQDARTAQAANAMRPPALTSSVRLPPQGP